MRLIQNLWEFSQTPVTWFWLIIYMIITKLVDKVFPPKPKQETPYEGPLERRGPPRV